MCFRLEDIRLSMELIFGVMGTIFSYATPVVVVFSVFRRKKRLWPALVAILGVLSYLLLFSIMLPWPFLRSDARVVYPLLIFALPAIWAYVYHFFKALLGMLPCSAKRPIRVPLWKKKTRGLVLGVIGPWGTRDCFNYRGRSPPFAVLYLEIDSGSEC